MSVLSAHELRDALSSLGDWTVVDGALQRVVTGDDFASSIAFVNRVAEVADAADHHPDLAISWDTVTVRLVTHSEGGITGKDAAMARTIDGLAA